MQILWRRQKKPRARRKREMLREVKDFGADNHKSGGLSTRKRASNDHKLNNNKHYASSTQFGERKKFFLRLEKFSMQNLTIFLLQHVERNS
jgi:hypothetical protein